MVALDVAIEKNTTGASCPLEILHAADADPPLCGVAVERPANQRPSLLAIAVLP